MPLSPAPPDEPGALVVGDGHCLAYEVSGRSDGIPAVALHGGPGSGSTPAFRRFFDPDAYRLVLYDQRGCGRSTPSASDYSCDLSVVTTQRLVDDLERLRVHLGWERWLVLGASWGSTLALAYATQHPERVSGLVLVGVTMTRRSEIDWLYRGVAPLFPEAWERFVAGVPAADRSGDLVAAYHRLLEDPDPDVRARAAADWSDWEWAVMSPDPGAPRDPRWADPAYRYGRARLVTHFFTHAAWLGEDELLAAAPVLGDTPGVLVHGRLDLGSPLVTAWELAKAWQAAELVVVEGAGHAAFDASMVAEVVAATDRLAALG